MVHAAFACKAQDGAHDVYALISENDDANGVGKGEGLEEAAETVEGKLSCCFKCKT